MSVVQKRKTKSTICLYVPDYFTPKIHLSPGLRHLEQEAWYVFDLIRKRHLTEKTDLGEYVGILAELLRLIVPSRGLLPRLDPKQPPDYKVLLDDLQANNAIESDNHFEPGLQATGYRLAPDLRGSYHALPVTNPGLLERLLDYKQRKQDQVKHPIHTHLKRWACRIEIDAEGAHRRLNKLSAATGKDYSSQRLAVQKIERGLDADDFHVDDFGRRFHTPIVSLAKELRLYLSYKGKALVNHDIACSQPFFLGLILMNLYNGRSQRGNVYNHYGALDRDITLTPFSRFSLPQPRRIFAPFLPPVEPFPQSSLPLPQTPSPSLLSPYSVRTDCILDADQEEITACDDIANSFQPHSDAPASLLEYMADCQAGRLYDRLAQEANTTRDQVKERLFAETLFCKRQGEGPLAWTMATLYPSVMAAVHQMKAGNEKDRHKISSLLLQRQESAVVLGKIATKLMLECRDVPIWTIHDSILTTPEYSALVLEKMTQEFLGYGVIPTIRVEDYGKSS